MKNHEKFRACLQLAIKSSTSEKKKVKVYIIWLRIKLILSQRQRHAREIVLKQTAKNCLVLTKLKNKH